MGQLLTLKEVARRLKIEPETVRRLWIKTGDLRAEKVGRQWRVDEDDIPEAVERKRRSKKPPDAFDDLNLAIAKGGGCTEPAQQNQLRREVGNREFTPPDIPE